MRSIDSVPAAFELTVVDGRGLLSWTDSAAASVDASDARRGGGSWAAIETLELEVPAEVVAPAPATAAASAPPPGHDVARLQNRRLALRAATLETTGARLTTALAGCPLDAVGVTSAHVSLAADGPRVVGRFNVGNRQAPFSIRVALEPRLSGPRRLHIGLADVRIFAHLQLPAPLIGVAVARAITLAARDAGGSGVRASGPAIDIDALDLALTRALVGNGWRLPDIKGGWLESVGRDGDTVRLRFASDRSPTLPLAVLEASAMTAAGPACNLEGERVPESLSTAEECLIAGDLAGAEAGYRRALAVDGEDRTARARLLALKASAGSPEAAVLAARLRERWPEFVPGFLFGAIVARESGDAAQAASLFAQVAALTEARGELEDAALARAAQAEAVARALTEVSPRTGGFSDQAETTAVNEPEDSARTDPTLRELTDRAAARGDWGESDRLFGQRLAAASDDQERAAITADKARVQLLGPDGAARALSTLRGIPLAITPEEGLVLRADLSERTGDLVDARQTLGELVTRAVATGDMARARELSAHQAELSPAHAPSGPPPSTEDEAAIPRVVRIDDSGNVTSKTAAVYAAAADGEARSQALGDLLQGFERLPPDRQHAAYTSFGRVAESTGDLEYAEEAYWRATRLDGEPWRRADDLTAHARVLLSRGNVPAAVTELEESLRLCPEHAGALALLADQAFQARDWDRARQLYARLDGAPDVTGAIARDALLYRRAILARAAGELDEAEQAFTALADLNPRHLEARQALAELALQRHDLRTAATRLDEVLRLLPLDALDALLEIRQRLGEIHVGLSDWGPARYYVELVLAQDPAHIAMLELFATINDNLGLYAEAARAWDRLGRLYPQPRQRAEALFQEGEILRERLGDDRRAFDSYLKSSDLDPTFVPTALRLIDGYFSRGLFDDAADVGEELGRGETLPHMGPALRLRLALSTALARGDASRGMAAADLGTVPWNPELAAAVLAVAAENLASQPPRVLERAGELFRLWHGGAGDVDAGTNEDPSANGHANANGGANAGGATEGVWAALLAEVALDPGSIGAVRALGWLADRRSAVAPARVFFSIAVFVDGSDGVSAPLEALGLAARPQGDALALGGPADHPEATGDALPMRRCLAALARGLAGFRGPDLETAASAHPAHDTENLALGGPRDAELRSLAATLGTPPFRLVASARSETPGEQKGVAGRAAPAVVGSTTQPATIEVSPRLLDLPPNEQTFLLARAFDRLRGGLALLDNATGGTAAEVGDLLDGARAAIGAQAPPDSPLAKAVAHHLSDPESAAALLGASPAAAFSAELAAARALLTGWDTFRAAAGRASDRFALLACRHPLAALRALYADEAAATPGTGEPTERERRIRFLRTGRVRDLLRFLMSAEYARMASPGDVADADA